MAWKKTARILLVGSLTLSLMMSQIGALTVYAADISPKEFAAQKVEADRLAAEKAENAAVTSAANADAALKKALAQKVKDDAALAEAKKLTAAARSKAAKAIGRAKTAAIKDLNSAMAKEKAALKKLQASIKAVTKATADKAKADAVLKAARLRADACRNSADRAAKAEERISAMAAASEDKKAHILFIGNSLTYVGEIPETFAALTKLMELPVTIDEKTYPGYTLANHLNELRSGKYDSLIKKADIVVLQEYGGVGIDSITIKGIQDLFDKDTEFYFLMTEFDINDKFDKVINSESIGNMKYIPSGYAHNLLLQKGFSYSQLHVPNDYHPNKLYGYLGACTVYSMIFDTTCRYLPYTFLDKDTLALIPGSTGDKKSASIDKIQQTVMEAVDPVKKALDKRVS